MGDSRPNSRPSSRVSIFSEDQYGAEDGRIPITEQHARRMQHLAAKAGEWGEPGIREGIHTDSMVYMMSCGNESWGSKLDSSKTMRQKRGELLGEAAGRQWVSMMRESGIMLWS